MHRLDAARLQLTWAEGPTLQPHMIPHSDRILMEHHDHDERHYQQSIRRLLTTSHSAVSSAYLVRRTSSRSGVRTGI